MDGFSLTDIIIALILGSSALWGYFRGLAREVTDVLIWVAAAVGAFSFKAQLVPLLSSYLPSDILAEVAAFAILFLALLILLMLVVTPLMKIISIKSMKSINQILGLFYGLARGFLICAILWIVGVMILQPKTGDDMLTQARLGPTIHSVAKWVYGASLSLYARFDVDNQGIEQLLEAPGDYLSDVDRIYGQPPLEPQWPSQPPSSISPGLPSAPPATFGSAQNFDNSLLH